MTYQPWTHAEEEALRILAPLGARACAEAFDRSHESIKQKAKALGVSLKRKTFHPDLTLTYGPAVLRRIRDAATAPLCPACAKLPATVRKTGLCAPCHLEALKTVHEEEIAKVDAQRELWAARSKLRRRRRSLRQGAAT
jgi:hypothetical protein